VTLDAATRDDSRVRIARLVLGVVLIGFWWTVSWLRIQPLSDHYFFPLWLGYILTIDAVLSLRSGTSPIDRSGVRVAWMFIASVPLWWIFEGFNSLVRNWTYHLPRSYSSLEYFLLASLAFSTVIPALLTTTELVRSFGKNPLQQLPALELAPQTLLVLHLCGWLMAGLVVAWPNYAFPLVWISLIFILEPIVTWIGGHSVATYLRSGDWSPVFNLGVAGLLCGFFWEMWNVYALPKWTYDVPHVDWLYVFEMPVLGYGGYIPFGIEVFVIYALFRRLFPMTHAPEVPVSSRERDGD
jgi:hypothetical protein